MINLKVIFKDANDNRLTGIVIQEYTIHNEKFVKIKLNDNRTFVKCLKEVNIFEKD